MDIEAVRTKTRAAILPVKPADSSTIAPKDMLFGASRTHAGGKLPPYYLLYFMLVDLLGFKNLGRWEKLAWSVPLDFQGHAYLVEHRKSGVGLFAARGADSEAGATEVVRHLQRGIKVAEPYFAWRAAEAVRTSQLNVVNHATELFERLEFFLRAYRERNGEAERRKDDVIETNLGPNSKLFYRPSELLFQESSWLALACIESFFSWTEHVFILIAILLGRCRTGDEVAKLVLADWGVKYRSAIDISDSRSKSFYDELLVVRQQLRNFIAHGAFGKQGEAFTFHSGAGAVPVQLSPRKGTPSFRVGSGIDYVEGAAIQLLRDFVDHLWSGPRAPAKAYIQEYQLPVILTCSQDYADAMRSPEAMEHYARRLAGEFDRSANMDW